MTNGTGPINIGGMLEAAAKILSDISAYCVEAGITETTFGRLSVNDGKFVARLRTGRVTVNLVERAAEWMKAHPAVARRPANDSPERAA